MKSEQEWREEVLRRLAWLAGRRVNDGVKLAFLSQEELEQIDRMDLSGMTEFRRHGNGAVEVKFVDRLAALEKLFEFAGRGGDGFEAFLEAVRVPEKAEEETGEADCHATPAAAGVQRATARSAALGESLLRTGSQ